MLSEFTEFDAVLHCVQTDWDILFLRLSIQRDSRENCLFHVVTTMPADYNRVIQELKISRCVLEF
jgi:hypothetical protein